MIELDRVEIENFFKSPFEKHFLKSPFKPWIRNWGEFRSVVDTALQLGYPIDYIPSDDTDRHTLLYKTIELGDARWRIVNDEYCKTIDFLLDKGADVNFISPSGKNILLLTSYYVSGMLDKELFSKIVRLTDDIDYTPKKCAGTRVWGGQGGNEVSIKQGTTALKLLVNIYVCEPMSRLREKNLLNDIQTLIDAGANTDVITIEDFFYESQRERFNRIYSFIKNREEQKIQIETPASAINWDYEI